MVFSGYANNPLRKTTSVCPWVEDPNKCGPALCRDNPDYPLDWIELCENALALQVQQWQAQIEARTVKTVSVEVEPHRPDPHTEPSETSQEPQSTAQMYEARYPRRAHHAPATRKDSLQDQESPRKLKRSRSTTKKDRSLDKKTTRSKSSNKKANTGVKKHELPTENDTTDLSAASYDPQSESPVGLLLKGMSGMQDRATPESEVHPGPVFNFSFNFPA
jgi:hypothetical protein